MNQIKYLKNSYAKSGTSFIDTSLEAILKHCETLPNKGKKGSYGSIFIYNSNQLGIHQDNETSTGIILIDIDYINKETADTIYNNFRMLYEKWSSLLAIQYSSSYYIKPEEKCGLHIYIKSEKLDYDEYNKQAQICLAIFAQLVFKELNIDLQKLSSKEKQVLDFHNTNLYQRFNLYFSTFKYNNYAENFNLDVVKFDDLEKLVIKYKLKLDHIILNNICPTINNAMMGTKKEKLKIDRNFKIGNYKGNDIRFRISIIADNLFKDNAKTFCDNFFYYENNKSIYTHYANGNTINPLIYKWLIENGYIIEKHQNIIENWISEYKNDIIREIINNRQIEIIAPTGTGKTTFINEELARHFNSVVIVPFNVTNKLYDKLIEVNASYSKEIPKNKPIVMIWDQAIKHWDEIKDRHIIIDEAHTLFFDRSYRDTAIKLILKLKENNTWASFITATPAGESEIFKMKQIFYYKARKMVRLNIKASKNIEWSQYNYIKKCLDNNWFDKIVLLDDKSAKKIYEKFIVNGYIDDICYIRSSTKDTEDFIDLRKNELLRKKLTICTCVAFNGLNFKNKDENILVVGSIQQGETTSCEIIQQIGRIRNSNVNGIYFYDPEKITIDDIKLKKEKALEFNNLMVNGVPDTFLSYDRRYLNEYYVKALEEIQEYQIKHANINMIVNELGSTGYIKGKYETTLDDDKKYEMNLELKRQESDELKEDILNDVFLYEEYTSEYKQKWAKDINYMISNPFYTGITIDTFINIVKKGTKNKLIETIIGTLKDIIRYVQVDECEYKKVEDNMGLYVNMISNDIDKKLFILNMKKIKDIRDKYKNMIKFNNGIIELNDIICDVIKYEEDRQLKEIEGAKKGKKCVITDKFKFIDKYGLNIGQQFDTYTSLAEYAGVNRKQIWTWKNKGWIE